MRLPADLSRGLDIPHRYLVLQLRLFPNESSTKANRRSRKQPTPRHDVSVTVFIKSCDKSIYRIEFCTRKNAAVENYLADGSVESIQSIHSENNLVRYHIEPLMQRGEWITWVIDLQSFMQNLFFDKFANFDAIKLAGKFQLRKLFTLKSKPSSKFWLEYMPEITPYHPALEQIPSAFQMHLNSNQRLLVAECDKQSQYKIVIEDALVALKPSKPPSSPSPEATESEPQPNLVQKHSKTKFPVLAQPHAIRKVTTPVEKSLEQHNKDAKQIQRRLRSGQKLIPARVCSSRAQRKADNRRSKGIMPTIEHEARKQKKTRRRKRRKISRRRTPRSLNTSDSKDQGIQTANYQDKTFSKRFETTLLGLLARNPNVSETVKEMHSVISNLVDVFNDDDPSKTPLQMLCGNGRKEAGEDSGDSSGFDVE